MSATLKQPFAALDRDGHAVPVDVTDDLYERLDRDVENFTGNVLVARHSFDTDWPTWDINPAGAGTGNKSL